MYTNIFYFIIAFSIFSLYDSSRAPALSFSEAASWTGILCVLFFLCVRMLFKRIERAFRYRRRDVHTFSTVHGRQITFCCMLAIALYAVFVYLLDVKWYLQYLPYVSRSEFAVNLIGIALFFLLLSIVWACAFPSYHRLYDRSISLSQYLGSHVRLNIAIVIPWLVFSIIFDIADLLPSEIAAYFSSHTVAGYFVIAVLFIALACFFPRLLVMIWNCTPMPGGALRTRLEAFCRKAGFHYSDLMQWDLFGGKLITAGVLGFIRKCRYVLISPALIDILSEDELEAVVAHEIGHIKKRHMLFYIIFILGYGIFSYAFYKIVYMWLLSRDFFFNLFISGSGDLRSGFYAVPAIVLVLFLLLYFRFLFGAFSRNFERQSDAYAIKIKGSADGIIGSLEKIAVAGSHSRSAPNWHHYSIAERSSFLQRCEADRQLIHRHDRKVSKMIGSYCLALILVGGLFFGFGDTLLGQSELTVLQNVVERRIAADGDDPELFFVLGNIYYEKHMFEQAEQQYRTALSLSPQEPEVLNNLAWLYATADDEDVRNPEKALSLALRAARLAPKPHILDTLAESYFLNGNYEKAVITIRKAIARKPQNIEYYRQQLEKFTSELAKEREKRRKLQTGEYISL